MRAEGRRREEEEESREGREVGGGAVCQAKLRSHVDMANICSCLKVPSC